MIQFERTNEKGEKTTAYTHASYLSENFKTQISSLISTYETRSNVVLFGTTIASYWALNNVPVLNNLVSTKLSFKGRFLAVSAGFGFVASLLTSVVLGQSLKNTHQNLLKNQVFPAWNQKDRVINPDRIFFELDDSHNNQPTIWHSAISTQTSIQRIIPDFVVGTAHKPHYPVAQHHHH